MSFPRDKLRGIVSRSKWAGVSIPAKNGEGSDERGDADLSNFLEIGLCFGRELEYPLLLSKDLNCLSRAGNANLEGAVVQLQNTLRPRADA